MKTYPNWEKITQAIEDGTVIGSLREQVELLKSLPEYQTTEKPTQPTQKDHKSVKALPNPTL
jgi:hypothetical protein